MKFKTLFLSTLLTASASYGARAQDHAPTTPLDLDSITRRMEAALPGAGHAEIKTPDTELAEFVPAEKKSTYVPIDYQALRDTIWDMGYPILERPTVIITDDGDLKIFACSGLSYSITKTNNKETLRSRNNEDIMVLPKYVHLWESNITAVRKGIGARNWERQLVLAIETISYHAIKQKASGKQTSGEKKFLRKFESRNANNSWRLNRNGALYYKGR